MTIRRVRKDGQAYANGIESFLDFDQAWLRRHLLPDGTKHPPQAVNKFAGQHNIRQRDTANQMAFIAKCFIPKRLRYQELVSG